MIPLLLNIFSNSILNYKLRCSIETEKSVADSGEGAVEGRDVIEKEIGGFDSYVLQQSCRRIIETETNSSWSKKFDNVLRN